MISLPVLRYILGNLFSSNIKSFLTFDLYLFIKFYWSGNHSRVAPTMGSWMIVDYLCGQVFVYPARRRPSIRLRFLGVSYWTTFGGRRT